MTANNVGRGCTTPVQQYDEAAFINYMDVVWPAATAATGAARDLAKERGEPYGTIITTTAGDKMSRSGRFMYDIYQKCGHLGQNTILIYLIKKNYTMWFVRIVKMVH